MDALQYTNNELEKQFNLLEIHLKQAPTSDKDFCKDCIHKHISTIEGLAEEGLVFSNNSQHYIRIVNLAREMRGKDYQKEGVELAQQVRQARKKLIFSCPTCPEGLESLTKNLNTSETIIIHRDESSNQKIKLNGGNMTVSYKESGVIALGQVAKEVVLFAEAKLPTLAKYSRWVSIVGGGFLIYYATRAKNDTVAMVSAVAGTGLIVGELSAILKGMTGGGLRLASPSPVRVVSPAAAVSSAKIAPISAGGVALY